MARIRDNSHISVYTHETQWGRRAGGQVSANPPTVVRVVNPDVMHDIVTKNYKKRSAMGEVIFSPMTQHKGTRTILPAKDWERWARWYQRPDLDQWVRTTGDAPCSHAVPPHEDKKVTSKKGEMETLVFTEAMAKVGRPDVATLTELAELRETIGFLLSPVKKMVTFTKRLEAYQKRVRDILARDERRMAKWRALPPRVQKRYPPPVPSKLPTFKVGRFTATDISSSWLAFRYGIMPLIYTFQDVEALLKKRAEGSPVRLTARAKDKQSVDLSSEKVTTQYWDSNYYLLKKQVDGGCVLTVRAGVLYEADASLSAQLGFRIDRVPVALYEVIPLSFVTDWFHNGMEVYDALTAELRVKKILAAWITSTVDYDVKFEEVQGPVISGTGSASGSLQEIWRGKWKTRRHASVGSDVGFRFRLDLNSKRVADGLALIHTFLSTGKAKALK